MLREMRHIRQNPGEPPRRWFSDDHWDLYIWERDDEIAGFQLCYGKDHYQRALTWMEGGKPQHTAVDEEPPSRYRAPIMIADGLMPISEVRERFMADSTQIDESIRDYVLRKLDELTEYSAIG
jgi:hypothetical protein